MLQKKKTQEVSVLGRADLSSIDYLSLDIRLLPNRLTDFKSICEENFKSYTGNFSLIADYSTTT